MKTSGKAAFVLALVSVLGLPACIPDTSGAVKEAAVPRAVSQARVGGTLTVGITEPDGVDPGAVHEPSGRLVVRTMCDQLIAFDPASGVPVPSLAASWSVAGRGDRLFVRLRKGVRFTDGRPLTADDVVFTLTRLASQEYASPAAALMAPVSGYSFIHGDAETDDARLRTHFLGVSAADSRTVVFQLDSPMADFFSALSDPATSPVSRAAAEADPVAFARRPVCAGPYRLSQAWTPGATVHLERVVDYAGANAALTQSGKGYADQIEFRTFASRDVLGRAFATGSVDVAQLPSGRVAGKPARGEGLLRAVTSQTEFVGLPTTTPPFDNPWVRVALSQALDRAVIARAGAGGPGAARTAAMSILPPTLGPGIARANACGDRAPARAEPDRARATLARVGVTLAGRRVSFFFNDEFDNRAIALLVAAQWKAVFGLRARLVPLPFETLLARGQQSGGMNGVFRFSWVPEYPSADRVLEPLFHPDGIGRDNLSHFGARDFDDAIRAARRAVDDDIRRAAYQRAEDVVCQQMPMIPLFFAGRAFGINARAASASGRALDVVNAEPLLRELFVKHG